MRKFILFVFLLCLCTVLLARAPGISAPAVAVHNHGGVVHKSYPHSNKVSNDRSITPFYVLMPALSVYKFFGIDVNIADIDLSIRQSYLVSAVTEMFNIIFMGIVCCCFPYMYANFHGRLCLFTIGVLSPATLLYYLSYSYPDFLNNTLLQLLLLSIFDSSLKALLFLSLIAYFCEQDYLFAMAPNLIYKNVDISWDRWIRKVYPLVQQAITKQDLSISRDYLGNALLDAHTKLLQTHKLNATTNIIEHVMVKDIRLVQDSETEKIMLVTADMRDYTVNAKADVISGSRNIVRVCDTLVLRVAKTGNWYVHDIIPSEHYLQPSAVY